MYKIFYFKQGPYALGTLLFVLFTVQIKAKCLEYTV